MKHKRIYWTRETHIFRPDEYICSVCGYHSDEPYVECPNCDSLMGGIQYGADWADEMEVLDALLDD